MEPGDDSEHKYRDLYDNSPDMYLIADVLTGRITDCNRTLSERLGYTKDELIDQPSHIVYHPDFSAEARAAATLRFQETGEFIDVERTLRCKDGRSIPVSLNVRAIRDRDGRILAARAVFRDITARRQAELDLKLLVRLDDVLQSALEEGDVLYGVSVELARHLHVARCAFVDVDLAADRVTIQPDAHGELASAAGSYALATFGAETIEAAIRGATVVISDAASDPRTAARHEQAFVPLGIRAYVSVPLLRSGVWVATLFVSDPEVRVWQDRELHLLDLVSERVWAWIEHLRVRAELHHRSVQQAVAKTEARFRIMVDAIQDHAVFMLDAEGVITTWNAGGERITGYTADEIIGRTVDTFHSPEDRALGAMQKNMLSAAHSHGWLEVEGWRMRKDGSQFWAAITVTRIRDADGQVSGFAVVTRDFTEQRRHEEERQARQAQLTQHLKEREILLQEIHHRVKNNLQVISSLINLQVRRLEDGASRSALEECQTRVLAIALIHEKLYQSKNYAEVQFADYARGLAANVFHTLGVSRSNIRLELAIDPIPLSIDRAIPCGLLINELITNALKHAFPGERSGMIRVSLAAAGEQLRLEVRDDGVGLPDGWNAYKSRSLGLQLVVTLAEQLAGQLAVDGTRGASFQLTFPGTA